MVVKIFASPADRQRVARRLLDAADDPQQVRVEKTRGWGFVIPDALAEKLGLSGDEDKTETPSKSTEADQDADPSSDTTDKPTRGRPAGKANKSKES